MKTNYNILVDEIKKQQNDDKIIEILGKMSQKTEKFANKVIEQEDFDILKTKIKTDDYEFAKSLNFKNCLNDETKLVIVGTVTPWNGTEYGYFYTSGVNKVYGILDRYFGLMETENSLVSLKKQLAKTNDSTKKEKIVNKIIEVLQTLKIAFIDVADEVLREKHNARDDKILIYSLDFDSFKNANKINYFICTSKNTKECLDIIFDKLGFDKTKIVVCNQGWPHYKWETWETELNKIFKQ